MGLTRTETHLLSPQERYTNFKTSCHFRHHLGSLNVSNIIIRCQFYCQTRGKRGTPFSSPQPQTTAHSWGPITPELGDCHTARDTDNHEGLPSKPGVHPHHLVEVQPTPFLPSPSSQVQEGAIHKWSAICWGLCCFPRISSFNNSLPSRIYCPRFTEDKRMHVEQ